jgi:aminopeptidase N
MLRRRLGDEDFFKGLRDYYNAHHEGNATTEDLRLALEKSAGKNLKEFFARWVYGAGHPVYELSSNLSGDSLTIVVKQTQSDEAFLDPVPVEIRNGETKQRITISPKGKLTSVRVHTKGQPSIQIDPDGTLLKEVTTAP